MWQLLPLMKLMTFCDADADAVWLNAWAARLTIQVSVVWASKVIVQLALRRQYHILEYHQPLLDVLQHRWQASCAWNLAHKRFAFAGSSRHIMEGLL